MMLLTASVAGVALLVLLYIHVAICLATIRIYHEAYGINPTHDRWPEWYTSARHKRLNHFWHGFTNPFETLNRVGTTMTTDLVIIEFTLPHPKTRLNPKVHTIIPKLRGYATFN